jgi:hypothetical protein
MSASPVKTNRPYLCGSLQEDSRDRNRVPENPNGTVMSFSRSVVLQHLVVCYCSCFEILEMPR